MKPIITLSLALLAVALLGRAPVARAIDPDFIWAVQGGDGLTNLVTYTPEYAYDVALDSANNAYVTGYFTGTAMFGTNTVTSVGSSDMFLAKYDPDGNCLWVRQAGGDEPTVILDIGYGVAVNAADEAYVTGSFRGTANFGGTNTLTSAFAQNMFLAKYDAAGNCLWARQPGGLFISIVSGRDVAVDSSSNVYVTGAFDGSSSLMFGNDTLSGTGSQNMFLAKYDAQGNDVWGRQATGITNLGYGLAVDGDDQVYVTGEFNCQLDPCETWGTATFGDNTVTSSGGWDAFLAKYDAAGNALWARGAGGSDWDRGLGVAANGNGHVYLTGKFTGQATFGTNVVTSSGVDDIFLAQYDTAGHCTWVQPAGGSSDTVSTEAGYAVATDPAGAAYLTGSFEDMAMFGSTTLTSLVHNVFVAKYDTAGNPIWARQADSNCLQEGYGIAVNPAGHVYVAGMFIGPATFGTNTLSSGFCAGLNNEVFLARLSLPGPWQDAAALGDDWYWLDWFGFFNLGFYPWAFHLEHGFLYPFGTDASAIVFWDAGMNAFWWTSATVYPYVYRFSDQEWLWYLPGSVGPRWFVILSSGVWQEYW